MLKKLIKIVADVYTNTDRYLIKARECFTTFSEVFHTHIFLIILRWRSIRCSVCARGGTLEAINVHFGEC
jgi:hypothetical protein